MKTTTTRAQHVKADPACIHYKEAGPFRRYLNERGRGKGCPICVPNFNPRDYRGQDKDE